MSNVYALEPHPTAKVILHTTAGDVEMELWGKETPKATRNFIQLCLEGYYDNTIFHRIVPNFIVQGGDPTGSGHGGDSIYEEGFPDEFHSRLRFTRRGLVGMANTGKNDNGSQFFITLDKAEELNRKHTLFGRVVGDTVFNVVKMSEMDVDKNDRPLYPPKIKSTEVVLNPFDDIVPRVSQREQQEMKAREQERLEQSKKKKKETKKLNLLSFGEEAEELESKKDGASRTKMKSSHDLVGSERPSTKETYKGFEETPSATLSSTNTEPTSVPVSNHKSEERPREKKKSKEEPKERELTAKEKIEKLKNDIKNLGRGVDNQAEKDAAEKRKKPVSLVEQQRQQYLQKHKASIASRKGRDKSSKSQVDNLKLFEAFQKKLSATSVEKALEKKHLPPCPLHSVPDCESCYDLTSASNVELTDKGWMGHLLNFEKDLKGKDLMKRKETVDDYVVIDPREREAGALQQEYEKNRGGHSRSSGDASRKREHDRGRDDGYSRHSSSKRSRDYDTRR